MKQQPEFAELVKMRHRSINLCRETLAWLGHAADDLEAECADLCERAAGLPERMQKRLSAVRIGNPWDSPHAAAAPTPSKPRPPNIAANLTIELLCACRQPAACCNVEVSKHNNVRRGAIEAKALGGSKVESVRMRDLCSTAALNMMMMLKKHLPDACTETYFIRILHWL